MPQETIPEEDEEGSHADKQTPQEIKIISSVGRGKKGMVLPFQPLAMAFKNVSYFIDMPAVDAIGFVNDHALDLIKRFLTNKIIDVLLYVDRLDSYQVDNLDKQIQKVIYDTFQKQLW
ncbi:hypothetical protein SUGI_1134580 [Cryptomeria japonica]|nr:hypothetical protein SUGI_1134580 [Cryptomeria japonica]